MCNIALRLVLRDASVHVTDADAVVDCAVLMNQTSFLVCLSTLAIHHFVHDSEREREREREREGEGKKKANSSDGGIDFITQSQIMLTNQRHISSTLFLCYRFPFDLYGLSQQPTHTQRQTHTHMAKKYNRICILSTPKHSKVVGVHETDKSLIN